MRIWEKGLTRGAAWAAVVCLLACRSILAQVAPGVPLDVCGDLRMKEVVTHNCTFAQTSDVDYTPEEPAWNWIWAHRMLNDVTSTLEATFELDQVRGDLCMTVADLTASQWEGGMQVGYDPVAITINDEDGDPFNGTNLAVYRDTNEPAQAFDVASHHNARFGIETDTFILPTRYLRAGVNTVRWTRGVAASSHRVQAFRIYSPSQGRFQFTSERYRVDEAGRVAVLRVLRQDGWEGEVSVRFRAIPITATPGSDYEDVSGVLTFGAHEQSQTILVPINDDGASEGPETFMVQLSEPSSGCVLGSPAAAVVTIVDDETQPAVLYVDCDAAPGGDGRSWKTALDHLPGALAMARLSRGVWQEIWVAEGTYAPGAGANSQNSSFDLVDGVALYGGFKGTETARSQRDPLLHPTILSGDLQGDDRPGYANTADNAYHVVRAQDVGAATILDGFTIQGGYTTTLYGEYTSAGAGLFFRHASPVVRNCTIQGNRAMEGAGAFCYDLSYPVFEACRFEHNLIDVPITGGAGMTNRTSSPLVLNCTFVGNLCIGAGGAMCNWDCSPVILNCTFCWNTATEYFGRGGAFCTIGTAFDTRPVLGNCILTSNFANEGTQFAFLGTSSLYVEHSIVEDTGNLNWIEAYRQAGLERGPGIEDRDIQLTPDGHLISDADAAGGLASALVTTDIDGDVRTGRKATLGADVFVDSDGDGLPDAWELRYFGGITAAEPNADPDGDGISNLDEYRLYGSHPRRQPLYVDGARGDDRSDGSPSRPKRTIQAGLDAALPGDTVLLAPGTYAGPANTGIDFLGRQVVLRGAGGTPEATVVDCNGDGYAFRFADGETPTSALVNLTITHGRTEVGGVVQCHTASPLLAGCRIADSLCTLNAKRLTLLGGQAYDFSEETVTEPNSGDVYYVDGWLRTDGLKWEIVDLGPTPIGKLGPLPDSFGFEAWGTGAWNSDGLQAIAGHSYAIRTFEYERYALVQVISCDAQEVTVDWLYVNAKSWPGEYRTGGLSVFLSAPRVTGCTIQGNRSDGLLVQSGGLSLSGDLRLIDNDLETHWALLDGPGRLVLGTDATWQADRVFLRCGAAGAGTIRVAEGSQLQIEHQAVVALAGDGAQGSIVCDGLLLLKDQVVLRDARIQVNRLSAEDEVRLDNCVIQAEAGAPYGQFFVSGQASIDIPSIDANGDRYLDVDPRVYDCNDLRVQSIRVRVDEGVNSTTGGLFELRGLDLFNVPWEPNVYVYPVAKVPDFGPKTWTIDRLELVPGAKLNLTNRFDFQAPFDQNGDQEVLFVKELILGEGSILNTAFNRVYCEHLVKADSAQIISIPLLGFSLNNITFDDARDFSTRVKSNNVLAMDPAKSVILVSRVVGQAPDPNGMMRMRNLVVGDTLTYARALGLFAKASEERILIRFQYLFEGASPQKGSSLQVYLTDSPDLLPEQVSKHRRAVGVVYESPLFAAQPGTRGSDTFGTVEIEAQVGDLDFTRGVWIELRLIAPAGDSVLINNWDPLVQPNPNYCWDLAWPSNTVDAFDFLAVMSESGRRSDEVLSMSGTPIGNYVEGFFCRDGYVTPLDAMAANWLICGLQCPPADPIGAVSAIGTQALVTPQSTRASRTSLSASAAGSSSAILPTTPLAILGKRYAAAEGLAADDFLAERLYGLSPDAGTVTQVGPVLDDPLNVKLVRAPDGQVYVVNLARGVVKISTNEVVIPPCVFQDGDRTLTIGVQNGANGVAGLPILDVAFDSGGDAYVVPVVFYERYHGQTVYLNEAAVATARLRPAAKAVGEAMMFPSTACPGGSWAVAALNANSNEFDNVLLPPGASSSHTVYGQREVEVDEAAGVTYVLNVHAQNTGDMLLACTMEVGRADLYRDTYFVDYLPCNLAMLRIEAPGPLHLSKDFLYLGGRRTGATPGSACVFRLPKAVFSIDVLAPSDVEAIEVVGMDQVTGITEDPATGTIWVTGIALKDVPTAFDSTTEMDILNRPPFYSARVASFPANHHGPVQSMPLTGPGCDLVLPLDIEWTGPTP
jgi:hypothetical protein